MQPGELNPGPWWRRLLCTFGVHRRVGKVRVINPASRRAGIVMYCPDCWKRLT